MILNYESLWDSTHVKCDQFHVQTIQSIHVYTAASIAETLVFHVSQ